MKTRAAVCRAFGAPLTIESIDLAAPGPGEVLIRMSACAICHSDIVFIDGAWGGDLPRSTATKRLASSRRSARA